MTEPSNILNYSFQDYANYLNISVTLPVGLRRVQFLLRNLISLYYLTNTFQLVWIIFVQDLKRLHQWLKLLMFKCCVIYSTLSLFRQIPQLIAQRNGMTYTLCLRASGPLAQPCFRIKLLTIEWNSANGGSMNSKLLNSPRKYFRMFVKFRKSVSS